MPPLFLIPPETAMPAIPEVTTERPARAIGVYDRPSPWRSPRLWIAVALGVTSALIGVAFLVG